LANFGEFAQQCADIGFHVKNLSYNLSNVEEGIEWAEVLSAKLGGGIETRRRGERREFCGEELESIVDCLYPQNSALSSACSPSPCFVEASRHIAQGILCA
jgi:hypothetical protein